MDPWSGGGVLRAPNDKIVIVIIPDTAHHLDLRKSHPKDPPSVIYAREKEKQTIHKWIEHDNLVWNAKKKQILWENGVLHLIE